MDSVIKTDSNYCFVVCSYGFRIVSPLLTARIQSYMNQLHVILNAQFFGERGIFVMVVLTQSHIPGLLMY